MILEQITELLLVDILERGVPNKECIVLRVETPINMAQYGLTIGVSTQHNNMATPIRDNFFWFGEGMVEKGDWIFIYTGSGTPRVSPTSDNLSKIYTLYWNRPLTLFQNSLTTPILFKMEAVQVLPTPKSLP